MPRHHAADTFPAHRNLGHRTETPAVTSAITRTDLPFPLIRRGKVRDVYDVGDDASSWSPPSGPARTTWCCPPAHPRQGYGADAALGSAGSVAWRDGAPNHGVTADVEEFVEALPELAEHARRSAAPLHARQAHATRFPIECVVRGYLRGSAWSEYRDDGHAGRRTASDGPRRQSARLDPSRSSRRRPRPRGPRREHPLRGERELGAAPRRELRDLSASRSTRTAARAERARASSWPTPSSSSGTRRRRAARDRRSADARLLALLAADLRSRPAQPASTSSRCATGCEELADAGRWDKTGARPRAPRRGGGGNVAPLPGRVPPAHGRSPWTSSTSAPRRRAE